MEDTIIHLLWTGGRDSTYRLLEAVIKEKLSVQTYYVIDTGRPSTLIELRTQEKIKEELFKRYPETRERVLPANLSLKSDIQLNQEITAKYQRLAEQVHIGIQYEWLARFAEERGLTELEICNTAHPPGDESALRALLLPELIGQGHACRLRPAPAQDELGLFHSFRFPTIHLTKLDMAALAGKEGFADLMAQAWFCHTPTREGVPCGKCIPCITYQASGLEPKPPLRQPRLRVPRRYLRKLGLSQ